MQTLLQLSNDFFNKFVFDIGQKETAHSDKQCFRNALSAFLSDGKREDAFTVYFCFCEIFNVFGQGYANTKKLLEMLSDHEYHSGELLAKHRDHYSHSVYVFAIGLAIYAGDGMFRKAFDDFYGYSETEAPTQFLKFWGLTALFHDIGYPFQLAHEQVKVYCEEIWGKNEKNLFISYGNVDEFISLDESVQSELKRGFSADISSINGLLAYGLYLRMKYDAAVIEPLLKERVICQPKFMDHAYFSAVLLARKLFSVPGFEMSIEYLDVLTAILLHNNFNKYEIPNRRPISLSDHPLSYLLILCDELQSWDRMAYGKISKRDPIAWTVKFEISDGAIKAVYAFDHYMAQEYDAQSDSIKTVFNKNYLEMKSGEFVEKIIGSVNCGNCNKGHEGYIVPSTKLLVETEEKCKRNKFVSPFSSDSTFLNLYDLAKLIHMSYSDLCKGADKIDEEFGNLPLEFKISNIDLAKSYASKLEHINCFYSSKDFDLPIVKDANSLVYSNYKDNTECLCREEHVRWVKEKLALGWKYGTDYSSTEERNQKKIHRCIVPFEQLSDEDKSKDYLMIGGIFSQLQKLENKVKIYNYSMIGKPKLEIAGVGHRYFASDTNLLKKEIKSVLEKYLNDFHVIVRTCFAYGADQLIAECALELGLTVKANIPLSYEEYIQDVKADALKNGHVFTEDDELRMRHLLAQTVVCKTISDPKHKYETASKYIVDKCDVLLALWDGQSTDLFDEDKKPINRGGTYDSIRLARKLHKTIYIIQCEK